MHKKENTVYVYKLYDLNGGLAYIGETVDLNRRISEHKDNYILGSVSYTAVKDKYESVRLEAYLIRKYNPKFNRRLVQGWADEGEEYISGTVFREVTNLDDIESCNVNMGTAKAFYKDTFADMVTCIKTLHNVSSFDEVLRSVYSNPSCEEHYGCFYEEGMEISVGLYNHKEESKVIIGCPNTQLRVEVSEYFKAKGIVVATQDRVIKKKITSRVLTKLIHNHDWFNSDKYTK